MIFRGIRRVTPSCFISYTEARRLVTEGSSGLLAYVREVTKETSQLDKIAVVSEFQDVFQEDLPGLPPAREIEFEIELVLGTRPESKAPYRLALLELEELKKELDELLEKGFIRPSVSPWGAPVLWALGVSHTPLMYLRVLPLLYIYILKKVE